jgi:mitogen-activated protein kinase organizer 1
VVKFNSEGRYCLTGGQDKIIRLWNPYREAEPGETTGALVIKAYAGHGYEVTDVAIAGDNNTFASCGGDKCAYTWDVPTGRVIRKIFGHERRLNAVAYNDEATVLCSASDDKTVRCWDLKSSGRAPIQVLPDFRDNVTAVSVPKERGEIVAASLDGTVRRYDLRMGRLHTSEVRSAGPTPTPMPVASMAVSNDHNCVLAACPAGKGRPEPVLVLQEVGWHASHSPCNHATHVTVLQKETGQELKRYGGHSNSLYRLKPAFTSGSEH